MAGARGGAEKKVRVVRRGEESKRYMPGSWIAMMREKPPSRRLTRSVPSSWRYLVAATVATLKCRRR
jgi:hypothetical protein